MESTPARLTINANTRLYAVLGDPVTHSLSPVMHNAAFRQTGHNEVYVALHVTDLPGTIKGVRALNIHGCSL